jgi:hypothetical protein
VVTNAQYLSSGPLTELVLANGLTEQHLFDARYFPKTVSVTGPTTLTWDDAPVVLRVESWKYDPKLGSRVEIAIGPGQASEVQLKGDVIGVRMELTMSRGDWSRRIFLRRELDLENRRQRLLQVMAEHSNQNGT